MQKAFSICEFIGYAIKPSVRKRIGEPFRKEIS